MSVVGLYAPPPGRALLRLRPPQMIISEPVQVALCQVRLLGAPTVLMLFQLPLEKLEPGVKMPPVSVLELAFQLNCPPQTIICVPVQTALWWCRGLGALAVGRGCQLSLTGS